MPGPPIRTPSDHSPSAGSPRLIAGHHVLHRPLMPRHPPNAQKNKQNNTHATRVRAQRSKMLASTIQFTTNPPTPQAPATHHAQPDPQPGPLGRTAPDPDSVPPPTSPQKQGRPGRPGTPPQEEGTPTVPYTTALRDRHDHQPPPTTKKGGPSPAPRTCHIPLRKEVIQPHLPVRLPCYDFVPITSPTFDRSP